MEDKIDRIINISYSLLPCEEMNGNTLRQFLKILPLMKSDIKKLMEKEIEKAKFDSAIFFCRNFRRHPRKMRLRSDLVYG